MTHTTHGGRPLSRKKKTRLSAKLSRELGESLSQVDGTPIEQLIARSETLERLKSTIGSALSETHIVSLASTLAREHGLSLDDMKALGLPTDVLQCFPQWRKGSRRGFRPPALGLHPVPTGAGLPIDTLRLQLSPASSTVPYALMLIRDILRRLDRSVRLVVTVEPGANINGLLAIAESFHPSARNRLRFVEGTTATLFAQDNARAARDVDGHPVLLLPREFARRSHRADDELDETKSSQMFGVRTVRSGLFFEGGNVINDDERILIGVDTIATNMVTLGLNADEVIRWFASELGADVATLGELTHVRIGDQGNGTIVRSGQATFHIDMDCALLGRFGKKRKPRALLADAASGIDLLPAVLRRRSLFSDHFLPPDEARAQIEAEYFAYAEERLPKLIGYHDQLVELGYVVQGVPDLRIDPKENVFGTVNLDFTYCNVLPGLWRGRPSVVTLPFGVRELDEQAAACMEKAGVVALRLSRSAIVANDLMKLRGGLHCFCGIL
jgi:hypothetical protein